MKRLTDQEALEEMPVITTEEFCCYDEHAGFVCSRPKGHEGQHIACCSDHVCERWPDAIRPHALIQLTDKQMSVISDLKKFALEHEGGIIGHIRFRDGEQSLPCMAFSKCEFAELKAAVKKYDDSGLTSTEKGGGN